MMLGKKVSYIEVDYNEFERFAKSKYPEDLKDWEFVPAQECGNDIKITFYPSAESFKEEEWKEQVAKRYFVYHNNLIFYKLAYDGHIEPGEYLVKVSW